MTAADLAERLLGIGDYRTNLDHLIEELRPETGIGWEGPLLEFKATYRPSRKYQDDDANQPDKFLWNVLEAFIGFANASGGCVVLGIAERGRELVPGDWDPDGILDQAGKEDKDLKDHLPKVFFKPIVNGQRILSFTKGNRDHRYVLSEEHCSQLGRLVEFHLCRSQKLDCNAIVAIVRPVAKDGLPISVKKTVKNETESVVFHRDDSVACNRGITDLDELSQYWHSREPARAVFGMILNRPFKRGPIDEVCFSTVPAPSADFLGRERELAHLDEICRSGKIPLIHAGGGTGKTQLAFKYAAQYAKDYPGGCFYIPAEHTTNWDSALQEILVPRANALGILPAEWLGLRQEPQADARQSPRGSSNQSDNTDQSCSRPINQTSTVDIVNALIRRTRESGKILLVLDNVERPAIFLTSERLAKVFPQGFTPYISILVTSRTNKGIGSRAGHVADMPLGDLTEAEALNLLNGDVPCETDEERHAAEEIVRLLGCRALYIRRVAELANERARRSYTRILARLLDDKLKVVRPREDEEDLRTPAVIWDWTREHLLQSDDGKDDVRLARTIALFPADGVQDRILEAIWYSDYGRLDAQETLGTYQDDPELFLDALKRISNYSLIQYTPEEHVVRMHRLDRAAILRDGDIAETRQQLGHTLQTCLSMGPQDWAELAKAQSDLIDFCPIENLDGTILSQILRHMPGGALRKDFPWDKFSIVDWWLLLAAQPDFTQLAESYEIPLSPLLAKFISPSSHQLNPQDFCGAIWARILSKFPERASGCPLERLGKDDWLHLLAHRPEMMQLSPHPDILNVPGHRHAYREYEQNSIWDVSEWGHCLAQQPQMAEHCAWDRLPHDDIVAILKDAPDFAAKIPEAGLALISGPEWTEIANSHPELASLYPNELFPRKHGPGQYLLDDIAEQYGFNEDNGLDWAAVYKEHPEVLDYCSLEKLHPLHWCKLLLTDSSLARLNPPWEQIGLLAQKKTKSIWGFSSNSLFAKLLDLEELAAYRSDDLPTSTRQESKNPQHSLRESVCQAVSLSKLTDSRLYSLEEHNIQSILKKQPQLSALFPSVSPRDQHAFFLYNAATFLLDMPGALDFSYSSRECMPLENDEFTYVDVPHDSLSEACTNLLSGNYHADALRSIHQGELVGLAAKERSDSTLSAVLICIYPKLADLFDWKDFNSRELCLIMLNRPSLRAHCDWAKLSGHDWAVLLSRNPEFADVCDWAKFTVDDWTYLRDERPWMVPEECPCA